MSAWLAGILAVAAHLLLRPAMAAACAGCLSSGFGDRTYNWAFIALIITPFVVVGTIGGVLAVLAIRQRRHRRPVNLSLEETT